MVSNICGGSEICEVVMDINDDLPTPRYRFSCLPKLGARREWRAPLCQPSSYRPALSVYDHDIGHRRLVGGTASTRVACGKVHEVRLGASPCRRSCGLRAHLSVLNLHCFDKYHRRSVAVGLDELFVGYRFC